MTGSKNLSASSEEDAICTGQKSFISIHSTDRMCQVSNLNNLSNLEECNVEVLSVKEVFPSTSEESISHDDETTIKKRNKKKQAVKNILSDNIEKSSSMPTNSKSTISQEQKNEGPIYSDFYIPKNTLCVVGSNPGEPKMSYEDPPKKISKKVSKSLCLYDHVILLSLSSFVSSLFFLNSLTLYIQYLLFWD